MRRESGAKAFRPAFGSHGATLGGIVWTRARMQKDANFETFDTDQLVERRVRVAAKDVVFVKGICEASEGLCAMFAESGGDLILAAPASRARELDELVRDLRSDFGAMID
jgi:hypothetical protein